MTAKQILTPWTERAHNVASELAEVKSTIAALEAREKELTAAVRATIGAGADGIGDAGGERAVLVDGGESVAWKGVASMLATHVPESVVLAACAANVMPRSASLRLFGFRVGGGSR
jgi:hypothetical protein